MSKKNWHLKKYLSGKLPEPEIRAGDAWAHMSNMLENTSLPDSSVQPPLSVQLIIKYGLTILAGLGGICGVFYLVGKEHVKVKDLKISRSIQQTDILHSSNADSAYTKDLPIWTQQVPGLVHESSEAKGMVQKANRPTEDLKAVKMHKYNADTPDYRDKSKVAIYPEFHLSGNLQSRTAKRLGVNNKRRQAVSGTEEIVLRTKVPDRKADKNLAIKSSLPDAYGSDSLIVQDDIAGTIKVKNDYGVLLSLERLDSKPMQFSRIFKNQIAVVYAYHKAVMPRPKQDQFKRKFLENWHAGLEWNAASSFQNTKYIFSGADSLKRPYLLLVPGLWISKKIKANQLLTVNFFIHQPYFGGNKQIQKIADSTISGFTDIRFIKAAGVNVSLQYEYLLLSNWKLTAGISYSHLQRALFEKQFFNYANESLPGSLFSVRNQELNKLINPNLFTFRSGLGFRWQRHQFGFNLIVPLADISATSIPAKSLNGQIYYRFRIK